MGNRILLCFMVVCHIIGFGQNSIQHNFETTKQDSIQVSEDFQLQDWAYAVGLHGGYGVFTGDLRDNIKNIISYGISASFEYKKTVDLNIGVTRGLSKTKEDITIDDGIWNKGYKAEIFIFEASVGFPVIDEKFFKIRPYLGMASTSINGKKEIYLTDTYTIAERYNVGFNNTTFLLGVNCDIKLSPKLLEYYYFRIGYTYYSPHFENKYDRFNGNVHYGFIGWGRFSRPNKKKN